MPHALYDQTLKVLADSDPAALLSLLDALPPDTTTFVSPAPRELPLPARLPDLLYTVDANNTWLAHIELQIRDEARMDERMVEYMVLAWLWFRKPVKSFLILPTRGGMRPSPCSADTRAGDILLLVRYEVIRLWELPARQVLAMRRPSLLPFVPLMDSTEAEVVEAFQRVLNVPDESRRREWAGRFLLLGGLRYDKMMLVKLLEDHSMLTLSDLRESSFYELILEEGMEKGIEKGIERGRREGEAALLRRQLERRFGSLPSWALERINRADRATVEAWGERVLDAAGISLEDFLT